MARKSKLKSQLLNHNSTINEKNELASKVLAEEKPEKTEDKEVGIIDDLKKKILGDAGSDKNVEAEAKKKAEEEAAKKAAEEAAKKEAELKAKQEAEVKKKKLHDMPDFLL